MDQEMHVLAGQVLKAPVPEHVQTALVREGAVPVPVDPVYSFRRRVQDKLQMFPVMVQLPVPLLEFRSPFLHDFLH